MSSVPCFTGMATTGVTRDAGSPPPLPALPDFSPAAPPGAPGTADTDRPLAYQIAAPIAAIPSTAMAIHQRVRGGGAAAAGREASELVGVGSFIGGWARY